MELTRSELEIMDVFWETGEALSRSDILEKSTEKSWKDSSVHIMLNGLLAKKAIREAGRVRRGKTFGRVFLPNLTREEYYATTVFCHRYKPDLVGLVAALLRRDDITPDALNAIATLVEQRKNG